MRNLLIRWLLGSNLWQFHILVMPGIQVIQATPVTLVILVTPVIKVMPVIRVNPVILVIPVITVVIAIR